MFGAMRKTTNIVAAHSSVRMVANTNSVLAHTIVAALVWTNPVSTVEPLEACVTIARSIHANTMVVAVIGATKVAAVAA